ncbi:MAG: DUF488 domain-containing protein [Muribaculum sp.]|nr:DUF488 domain-containing protein [Muribaculaceae bacterium]MCM1080560.1 DUF488 domain-containing protein [Muribaculum sp.]
MATIKVKRIYGDEAGMVDDGYRIFVDRLWPRGESKAKFRYDLWCKEIAPSDELRKWFHEHPAERWDDFRRKYREELTLNPATKQLLKVIDEHPVVTLLFGAKDTVHNNAVVLAEYLTKKESEQ